MLFKLIQSSLIKLRYLSLLFFFFFQAEDGIRDWSVTGVQTCALPISLPSSPRSARRGAKARIQGTRPAGPHLADLALLPVVPAGSDQRRPAEQLSRRHAADRLRQRQRHRQGRREAGREAAAVGAVRLWQAPAGLAVPRRGHPDKYAGSAAP